MAAAPVPVRLITVGEPGALVATETLPLMPPVDDGANTALKVMVLFGVSVWAVKPLTLKPVPVALAEETTRLAVPVFFSVIVCELF